jgi:hypothetical protein
MTDTLKGMPMFPLGTKVLSHVFFDPDTPKTVVEAHWDGAEYRYVLVDANEVRDKGYLAKDLTLGGNDE